MNFDVNKKIINILKKHPEGGETFFNALDLILRSDRAILRDYIHWVEDVCGKNLSRYPTRR